MSDLTLTLNFNNYSGTAFNIDLNGWRTATALSRITQQCGPTLIANAGVQTLAYTQDRMDDVASGDAGIYCCWNNGSWRFGVTLYAPTQVLTLGGSPVWLVMSDSNVDSDTANWVASGSEPSAPYSWPIGNGLNIAATPISQHDSLTVNVLIQDAS